MERGSVHRERQNRAIVAGLAVALAAMGWLIPMAGAVPLASHPPTAVGPSASSVSITSFSFSPSTITSGSTTQGTIQISGGTPPFYFWLNNTAPGCQPPTTPYKTSNYTTNFPCQPSSTGNYNVHLDVVDSAAPATHDSRSTGLGVNPGSSSGGSGGNSNGSNGSGFSLPSGLFQTAILLGAVLLVSLVLIAAGTIATAVVLSRRLRQINETLAKQKTPEAPKPPA
jgi:hypothetical protein